MTLNHLPHNSLAFTLTERFIQLKDWLQETNQDSVKSLTKLAGDASFRCYYRLVNDKGSFVVMDAPPEKEPCTSFVKVTKLLRQVGIGVPKIYCQDLRRGFLLLSDLGDRLYLSELSEQNADTLYQHAFEALLSMQRLPLKEDYVPLYKKELLLREMCLFLDWYLIQYKKIDISEKAKKKIIDVFRLLIENAQAQPQVFVHRDYHSRNLLVCEDSKVGVLDYQDAVKGAITYDLVSLLKDCYINWSQTKINAWVKLYYLQLKEDKLLSDTSLQQFMRWFDWMGLQRHLKCLGIFTRLYLRDQKSNYLNDIPRVLNYAQSICQEYKELSILLPFLEKE